MTSSRRIEIAVLRRKLRQLHDRLQVTGTKPTPWNVNIIRQMNDIEPRLRILIALEDLTTE